VRAISDGGLYLLSLRFVRPVAAAALTATQTGIQKIAKRKKD
jgi:hypothetical protein